MELSIQQTPGENEIYVVWVNADEPVPYAARRLLMWHDQKWWWLGSDQRYRGHVYQCLGPLPALKLED